jgi:hypothetical protein
MLYAVVGLNGFIDLYAFASDGSGAPQPLTRTQSAALAPTPTPDGSGLFFLGLEPDGFTLRRLPLASPGGVMAVVAAAPELPRDLAPAVRPPTPETPPAFDRADVAPGRPYGLGRQELAPLLALSAASTGGVLEAGVRGGDVIGRLDWLALGSVAGHGWPAGGALAATWRGWPVALGFHLFRSRERPSEEGGGAALDLIRQGIELNASRDWQWGGGALDLSARALWDRVRPDRGAPDVDQRLGSLRAAWGGYRRSGLWRIEPALGVHVEAGSTGDAASWTRWGGAARLGLSHDDTGLALSWRRDASRDLSSSFDGYQLGGAETSLLPGSVLSNRISVPALPLGTRIGSEHEGERAELTLGFLPAPIFYERHRVWGLGAPRGDWLTLAGLEYRFRLAAMPVLRLPPFEARVGVARILEDPRGELEGSVRWWLITAWRP